MNAKNIFTIFLLSVFSLCLYAQENRTTGSIRGIVTDAASGQMLPNVTVVIQDSNPVIGTTTGDDGYFRLDNLPIGRYTVLASFISYEPAIFREILVSSVKDVFLEISLKEQVTELGEVVIRPKINKEEPLNRMSTTSARMLSVEEASRYAGGFDDPARLVSAFAGIVGSMNSNGIAIRGNSPQSLQWRIEGVEAPNPTHFSDITGVDGGILTALSSQVLGNSDFFTGAFPAEYGNALSGVFDMQLRNGNNWNYEHTAQLGVLGVEFSSEGPFRKNGQASYLFNYRYSSMALADDLFSGLTGDAFGMRYQDLSFKINIPTKRFGIFSLWGIGIIDHFIQPVPKDTAEWNNGSFEGMGDFRQTKAMGGIGHKIFLDNNMYLKTSLATSYTRNQTVLEHTYTDWSTFRVTDMKGSNTNVIFDMYLNRKFSAMHVNRTGINVKGLFYDMDYNANQDINEYPPQPMVNFTQSAGHSVLLSAYSQSSVRFGKKVTVNAGIHSMYFALNKKWTLEPRIGVKWQTLSRHALGLAYGLHSRHENLDYYFVQTGDRQFNKDLNFSRAHHLVLSYDWSASENMHLKIEPYYQYLYDIPVAKDSLLSMINYQNFYILIPLTNDGAGRNYGVDFTLERYLHNGYYWLLTASFFESLYKGGDGVWRDTRLNRNFLINVLGGKEWKLGRQKQNILGVNLRMSLQGGDRYIPIDEEASKISQSLVYDNSRAYQAQLSPAFISHFTLSYKINKKSLAHEFAVKIINANGYKEFSGYYYDYRTNEPVMYKSAIVIPNIYYRVEF
ncbi:MAG: carboxypeptidase-like regulatory domain-containing protein [Bacteroidales bacterium]|jgi:hypothetical protein|nr:carboxypeptidase-like regulatory domain-containing protein [Bacteroidales bacterium]